MLIEILDRQTGPVGRVYRALRSDTRYQELILSALAGLVGAVVGGVVVALERSVALLHELAFLVPMDAHLSANNSIAGWRVFFIPILGGLVIGVAAWLLRRWRPRDIVDAIEANALHGGRMSLIDSLNLSFLTVISVGCGGSIGLEAAYTQMGSGFASKFGQWVQLRRGDLRLMVGCGAAAAIAAAFDAPLAGAFYAFELVMGSYTLAALAPVAAAALSAVLVSRAVLGAQPIFKIDRTTDLVVHDYILFFGLGLIAAGLSIFAMRSVTAIEAMLRRRQVPQALRPALGGLGVGLIAFVYPQVLGSGHGAIVYGLTIGYGLPVLVGMLVAKIAASALSVGSGMRGGLFSSSLFIGALYGSTLAKILGLLFPGAGIDVVDYTVVGMGSVAAGIVGGPVTMTLLVLETTNDYALTLGVMVGVITCTTIVRLRFGYSFATWRFHVRGLRIQGAQDVGWISELTVGSMMSRGIDPLSGDLSIAAVRSAAPLGSTKQIFVVDRGGRFIGIVDPVDVHAAERDVGAETTPLSALLPPGEPIFLLPEINVRTALLQFEATRLETLGVVDTAEQRLPIGFLTEAFALKRYNQELERRRAEESGEAGLFSPAIEPTPSS
jgi:CIC family chloride channel protein